MPISELLYLYNLLIIIDLLEHLLLRYLLLLLINISLLHEIGGVQFELLYQGLFNLGQVLADLLAVSDTEELRLLVLLQQVLLLCRLLKLLLT